MLIRIKQQVHHVRINGLFEYPTHIKYIYGGNNANLARNSMKEEASNREVKNKLSLLKYAQIW